MAIVFFFTKIDLGQGQKSRVFLLEKSAFLWSTSWRIHSNLVPGRNLYRAAIIFYQDGGPYVCGGGRWTRIFWGGQRGGPVFFSG